MEKRFQQLLKNDSNLLISKFRACKMAKIALFEDSTVRGIWKCVFRYIKKTSQNTPFFSSILQGWGRKLISRKIWLDRKILKFLHCVLSSKESSLSPLSLKIISNNAIVVVCNNVIIIVTFFSCSNSSLFFFFVILW